MSAATFPSLTPRDIVDSCRSFGCQLSEDDIVHPSPGRVQHIYEWWLTVVLDLTIQDVLRAAEDRLDHLDYPELYRESITYSLFVSALQQMFTLASVDDFSLRDVTAPTPHRVRRNLSAIINFYLFMGEQAQEHFEPFQAKIEDLARREQEVAIHNSRVRDDIATLRARREEEEPEVERVMQDYHKCLEVVRGMKHDEKLLDATKKELKDSQGSLMHECAELATAIQQQDSELSRLRARLIQSPDRLKAKISDMGAQLQREKEALAAQERRTHDMGQKISSLHKYDQELAACIKLLDEWDAEIKKGNESATLYQREVQRWEELESERHELEMRLANLNQRLENVAQERERNALKADRKRAMLRDRQRTLTDEATRLTERKRVLDLEATVKAKEAAEVESQIRHLHQQCWAEIDRCKSSYSTLRAQVGLYSTKLNKALDAINESVQEPVDIGL